MHRDNANEITPMVYADDTGQITIQLKHIQILACSKLYVKASGYAN